MAAALSDWRISLRPWEEKTYAAVWLGNHEFSLGIASPVTSRKSAAILHNLLWQLGMIYALAVSYCIHMQKPRSEQSTNWHTHVCVCVWIYLYIFIQTQKKYEWKLTSSVQLFWPVSITCFSGEDTIVKGQKVKKVRCTSRIYSFSFLLFLLSQWTLFRHIHVYLILFLYVQSYDLPLEYGGFTFL